MTLDLKIPPILNGVQASPSSKEKRAFEIDTQ